MSFIKKITSKLIYTTLTAIAVLSCTMSAFAYDGIGTVTGSVVNVRSGESISHSVITTVSKGTELNVISKGDVWSKVQLPDGREGYIINDYLSVESKEGVVTGSAVNVRKTPGLDGEIIGLVYKGQTLPVVGRETEWVNVEFNGQLGWISAQYISDAFAQSLTASYNQSKGEQIVSEAMKHVGKPYVYGASGPSAFDCSGFTSYVYKQYGYNLNRTAAGQNSNGTQVSRADLKPGDVVLFYDRGYSSIGHAGIYIGNDQFVHANNASTGVIVTTISNSPYYSTRFVCGRRIV
ncbi:MAG: SH3 domain-containing protein [Clostridia bacterium]|nr:SH3 domain-containing protein [Clostridia bacterium]